MVQVVGLGAGGHAKVIIETLRLIGGYELVGLLDPKQELHGTRSLGVPIIGDDSILGELFNQGVCHAFIGLGSTGDAGPRKRLYQKARQLGLKIVPAIHPRATIGLSVELGDGPAIMAGAVINAGTTLGDNVIVNTGAIVEHDCVIGDHVHIATGARLAGGVTIGAGAHIGAGATVKQCIVIGQNAIVGMGAVVVKDVAPNTTVVGVPARPLQSKQPAMVKELGDGSVR